MNHHDLYAAAELMSGVGPGHIGGPAASIPPAPVAAVGFAGQGTFVRLLQFRARNDGGQMVLASPRIITVSIGAAQPAPNFAPFQPGPLVCRIEWGSGNSGPQAAEFDVPFNSAPVSGFGGVFATVLGDYVNVSVRNDAGVIPRAGDSQLGSLAGVPVASAALALGQRGGDGPVTLTRYAAFLPGGGLAAGASASVAVPAYACRYRVFRSDAAQTVSVQQTVNAATVVDGPYNVAANVPAPTLPIVSNAILVTVTNTGAAAIAAVGVIFELGL